METYLVIGPDLSVSFPRLGTVSDAEENADFYEEMEALEEMGMDYTTQINDVKSIDLVGVFALGVLAGLVMVQTLWGRIR